MENTYDEFGWLCSCGHFEESDFHCSVCGAEPPWGCDCIICQCLSGEDYEECDDEE